MDLSIIIPSYNTKDLLERCLDSVFESTKKSTFSVETIVVDNGSTDGSIDLVKKKFPQVKIIKNESNIGYGKANNQAIKQAKGRYILLLNSDIKALGDAISWLYSFASNQPHCFAGGKLLNEDLSAQPSCGPGYNLLVVFVMLFLRGDKLRITRYSPREVTQVDWVSGACLIGAKEAFLDVGLFDEGIFMYMEEIEFLYRAQKKGYTSVFYPKARFVHTGAASSSNQKTPVINIYRGLLYFYEKHRSIIEQWALRLLLISKAFLAITVGKLTGKGTIVATYEEAIGVGT